MLLPRLRGKSMADGEERKRVPVGAGRMPALQRVVDDGEGAGAFEVVDLGEAERGAEFVGGDVFDEAGGGGGRRGRVGRLEGRRRGCLRRG